MAPKLAREEPLPSQLANTVVAGNTAAATLASGSTTADVAYLGWAGRSVSAKKVSNANKSSSNAFDNDDDDNVKLVKTSAMSIVTRQYNNSCNDGRGDP